MKCPTCGHALTTAELLVVLEGDLSVLTESGRHRYAACPGCLAWLVIGPGEAVREMTARELAAFPADEFAELCLDLPARAIAARF